MEYRPVLPEHNDNISPGKPFKEFLEIAASLTIILLLVFWVLGLLVDRIVDGLSAETEAKISHMASSAPPANPPQRQVLVQGMVDRLRACTPLARATPVSLHEDKSANAAVGPAGNITVFTGLLSTPLSENGLAFVLAHELAHIEHRDHLRGMGRAIVMAAAVAVVTGGAGDIDVIAGPAMHLGGAKYSREREASADARALDILRCRYGHVGGATELFERFKDDDSSWRISHYTASHPAMQERIAAIRAQAAARGYASAATTPLPATIAKP